MTEHPLHDLAMAIRYDLTAAQGKLTELVRQIGELDLPEPTERFSFMNGPVTADQCETCGVGAGNHANDCQALHFRDAVTQAVVAGEALVLTDRSEVSRYVARAHTPTPEVP